MLGTSYFSQYFSISGSFSLPLNLLTPTHYTLKCRDLCPLSENVTLKPVSFTEFELPALKHQEFHQVPIDSHFKVVSTFCLKRRIHTHFQIIVSHSVSIQTTFILHPHIQQKLNYMRKVLYCIIKRSWNMSCLKVLTQVCSFLSLPLQDEESKKEEKVEVWSQIRV